MSKYADDYSFYKRLGICVRCKKEQAEPNRVMCWECNDKEKEIYRKNRETNREKRNKRDLDKYNKLKEMGICTYCKHEKAMPGKYKCEKCLSKLKRKRDAKREDIIRYERVSYGLCYICGKNELKSGFRVCESCYNKRLDCISKIMYMPASIELKETNKLFFKKG